MKKISYRPCSKEILLDIQCCGKEYELLTNPPSPMGHIPLDKTEATPFSGYGEAWQHVTAFCKKGAASDVRDNSSADSHTTCTSYFPRTFHNYLHYSSEVAYVNMLLRSWPGLRSVLLVHTIYDDVYPENKPRTTATFRLAHILDGPAIKNVLNGEPRWGKRLDALKTYGNTEDVSRDSHVPQISVQIQGHDGRIERDVRRRDGRSFRVCDLRGKGLTIYEVDTNFENDGGNCQTEGLVPS